MKIEKRNNLKANTKKRVYRYTSQLRGSPKLEPNAYYHTNKNKIMRYVDPLDVKVNGVKYHTVLEILEQEKEITDSLRNSIKGGVFNLTTLFNDYEYQTSNIELNALIQEITKLNIIHPQKEYTGYKFNDGGYVIGRGYELIKEVDGKEPEDFDKGYWTIIDGEWVLDDAKYQQLWSGVL